MKLSQLPIFNRERFATTIFVYVFLALFILFGALSAVFMRMQQKNLEKQLIDDGLVLSQILSQTARLGIFTENIDQLSVPVNALFNHASVCVIRIFTGNNELLVHKLRDQTPKGVDYQTALSKTAWPRICKQFEETTAPLRFSFKHNEEFLMPVWNWHTPKNGDALYFDTQPEPQAKQRTLVGVVSISLSRHPLEDAARALLIRITVIAVLFLLLAGLVTYLIVKAATKPLNNLIQKVRALGVSEIPDELGVLTETFSQMVHGLEEAFTTINDLNTSLEKKVEARTFELLEHGRNLETTNKQLEITLTELKNTQSQLVHAEKMAALGQLVAGVAHEINNTTNFISGALPPLAKTVNRLKVMLSDTADAPETGQEALSQSPDDLLKNIDTLLANIDEGARRTNKIVQDLKRFSRPGEESQIKTDIIAALESTLALMYNDYKYDVEIIRDFEPNLPQINCFPSELNQVFLNILLNAIYAIRNKKDLQTKGQIKITIRKTNGLLSLVFADNGCGIPRHIIGKIFDPFFSTKEVGKGTGLGLSVSYGIMKKHQGMINVNSKEGFGTEFELILPITPETKSEPPTITRKYPSSETTAAAGTIT